MPIKCENCNAPCCRIIGKLDPSLDRGDLVCKYLTPENRCSIYEKRPLICNSDLMYDKLFKDFMPRDDYDKLNEEGCIKLRSNYLNANKEDIKK